MLYQYMYIALIAPLGFQAIKDIAEIGA